MQLTLISEAMVRQVARRPMVLEAVRQALIAAAGDGQIYPVVMGKTENGSVGLKSGEARSAGALGFKYGSYFVDNRARGMPSHSSTTVLIDPETGFPTALVNANYLNGLRTAAANAAAVQALARPEAEVLGVIGAGHQAVFEVRAVADVRPLKLVKAWNRSAAGIDYLKAELADLGVEVRGVSRAEAIAGSDIVVTATAAREPLVMAGEVSPGTHISAMGADGLGKQELDPALVARARLFADYPQQSVRLGEFQHVVGQGLVGADAVTALGLVLAGRAGGRADDREITVFDSSGIALQDLLVAQAVVAAAIDAGLAQQVEF